MNIHTENSISFFDQSREGDVITVIIRPVSCVMGPLKEFVVKIIKQNNSFIAQWQKEYVVEQTRKRLFLKTKKTKREFIEESLKLNIGHIEKIKSLEIEQNTNYESTTYTEIEFIFQQKTRRQVFYSKLLQPLSLFMDDRD